MKKFNKVLALGLAGASVLTGGFMLSGCDATEEVDKTQNEQTQDEQKVVSSIAVNQESLPSYIIKGHFARTNITMTVMYEDGSTKIIDVLESMFSETDKEKLKNVGQYNLTINYGEKTATMYANVVDERYLLKEVVEANLDKDITLSVGNNTMQIDVDNKIMKSTDVDDGWVGYTWLNNNVTYDYEAEQGCNKSLASDWDWQSKYWHTYSILEILETGKDEEGTYYTIEPVEKEGINYKLKVKRTNEWYTQTKTYTFNDDFLCGIDFYGVMKNGEVDEDYTINYSYVPITLEVPAEIKAMESEATVHVASRIENLKTTMSKYLESDLEVSVFDNTTNTTKIYVKYDVNNNIIYREYGEFNKWYWTNGNYWYSKESDSDRAYKEDISTWESHLISVVFGVYDLSDCTIDISSGGQYYELTVTEEDHPDVWKYKYIFNAEEISKMEVRYNDQYKGYYTFNKTNVVLDVPSEIKALESSAQ